MSRWKLKQNTKTIKRYITGCLMDYFKSCPNVNPSWVKLGVRCILHDELCFPSRRLFTATTHLAHFYKLRCQTPASGLTPNFEKFGGDISIRMSDPIFHNVYTHNKRQPITLQCKFLVTCVQTPIFPARDAVTGTWLVLSKGLHHSICFVLIQNAHSIVSLKSTMQFLTIALSSQFKGMGEVRESW